MCIFKNKQGYSTFTFVSQSANVIATVGNNALVKMKELFNLCIEDINRKYALVTGDSH